MTRAQHDHGVDPRALLDKYYPSGDPARQILLEHSRQVADKAVAIATRLARTTPIDITFVEEAALLHDIGIRFTNARTLGCHGELPYLAHTWKGRELLEAEGLPRHALVCERHIGVGLAAEDIRRQALPLPERDMLPLTLEERVIAYADLFFSKTPGVLERSVDEVRASLKKFGASKVARFDDWHAQFCDVADRA
ncbi:MAG: HD domain-containing protein [Desulfuromonadales bacterium]|nr:HD domain-containing protein [Desulfuromonadales bacterium]MDT8422736.1 HD domain-containing protein [Desulfuromonadales bacterium]